MYNCSCVYVDEFCYNLYAKFALVLLPVKYYIFLTKITVTQSETALSYHRVRGLYFLAVIFAVTIIPKPFVTYPSL